MLCSGWLCFLLLYCLSQIQLCEFFELINKLALACCVSGLMLGSVVVADVVFLFLLFSQLDVERGASCGNVHID